MTGRKGWEEGGVDKGGQESDEEEGLGGGWTREGEE